METGPGDGASILNRPHDTEARTLLAWLGILSGVPRLHEQPLCSYEKTVMAGGKGAGSDAPRRPPAGPCCCTCGKLHHGGTGGMVRSEQQRKARGQIPKAESAETKESAGGRRRELRRGNVVREPVQGGQGLLQWSTVENVNDKLRDEPAVRKPQDV